MMSIPVRGLLAAVLLCTPPVLGQSFNINAVGFPTDPVPSSSYGAGANQSGLWNAGVFGVTTALVDRNGNPTTADLSFGGCCPLFGFGACLSGDDQTLMAFALVSGGSLSADLTGLLDGEYIVYTYAMAPHVPAAISDVSVTGSPDPTQTVGGDLCGGHLQGVSYALHNVTVVGGTLHIDSLVNTQVSTINGIQLVHVTDPGTAFCFGDGTGTPCPCNNNNNGSAGGCDWGNASFPEGGVLDANGSNSVAANDTYLLATGVENNFGIFFGASNQVNGGNGNPLNDGLRCAGGGLVRLIPPTMATGNQMTLPMPVQALDPGAVSGVTRRYQYWFRTPTGPCTTSANLTNGYEIVWMP